MSRKRPCGATSHTRRDGSRCGKRMSTVSIPRPHRRMPLTDNWVKPVGSTMPRSRSVGTRTKFTASRSTTTTRRTSSKRFAPLAIARWPTSRPVRMCFAASRRPSRRSFAGSKRAQKPGYPALQVAETVRQLHVPELWGWVQAGGTRLYLQGVGHLKVKLHAAVDWHDQDDHASNGKLGTGTSVLSVEPTCSAPCLPPTRARSRCRVDRLCDAGGWDRDCQSTLLPQKHKRRLRLAQRPCSSAESAGERIAAKRCSCSKKRTPTSSTSEPTSTTRLHARW